LVLGSPGIAELGSAPKIDLSAVLDRGHVSIHHHVFGASQLLDGWAARAVIPMRVADQENLGVAEAKPQFFHARPNHRHGFFQIAVDQNISLRRGDQINGEPLAADVINISDDPVGRKRIGPVGRLLRHRAAGKYKQGHENQEAKNLCHDLTPSLSFHSATRIVYSRTDSLGRSSTWLTVLLPPLRAMMVSAAAIQ